MLARQSSDEDAKQVKQDAERQAQVEQRAKEDDAIQSAALKGPGGAVKIVEGLLSNDCELKVELPQDIIGKVVEIDYVKNLLNILIMNLSTSF